VSNLTVRDRLLGLYNNEMLSRFVIDEAHCVSSWGHDFRKDYKELSYLKKEFPETPIVALTATARTKVMQDTMRILGIEQSAQVFSVGFDRPNLFFEVRQKPTSTGMICVL
jgi:bloom syndrome protein